ncbi:glycosyltransferase family 1 protein [Salinimicrobium marinum]|uniref:Glycosyltransferase family 1 protein n=1 Tax=Salinimicrobium marinum TaxID=680283 RepID=A0A918S9F2_9FLAO|nr:glycosyltransferase family 4 protein [Salinimicrobium marinum]GHA30306.1 glycosyltransferase family 1 protein [Salinimicrobium marinum]
MRKLKILQLIQKKQYRGAEVFCCQLSNHLIELGHEVEVYSIYDGNASLPLLYKQVKTLARPRNRRFIDYHGWSQLARIIEEFQPDIVQANAADTLKYAVLSKIFFNWKKPLVYRNASASSFYVKTRFSKKINEFLLKRVDAIVSVSKASKDDLNKLFPFTSTITSVVPVGVEVKGFLGGDHFKTESQHKKKLLHIGSFTKEKNHYGLLDIFQRILNDEPSVELHLVGEGILRDKIEQKVSQLDLKGSVHFHGEVEDPTLFLKSSDIFMLPSLIEGLPAVVVEAMNQNLPVVAYNVGGISEVLSNNTGYLIEKNNESSFADAVLKDLENSDKQKVENAFNLVSEKFRNSEIAKQFLQIYAEIRS